MRILFLISNFPDKNDPVSGIFYKRTILELVKHDVEIIIIAPRNIIKHFKSLVFKKKPLKEFNNVEENLKISVYRPFYFPIPAKLSNRLKVHMLYRSISRCIKQNDMDFDIIDSRYVFPWCYIASKISKKISKPFLSNVVGDDINLDIFQSGFIRSCVKSTLEQANGIVCVSEELQKGILTNFGISNTHLIYDGIDFDGFRKFIDVKEKSYKFLDDKLTIGYVGHMSPGKGCDILLSIINLTGNKYNWIIIGDGVRLPARLRAGAESA